MAGANCNYTQNIFIATSDIKFHVSTSRIRCEQLERCCHYGHVESILEHFLPLALLTQTSLFDPSMYVRDFFYNNWFIELKLF